MYGSFKPPLAQKSKNFLLAVKKAGKETWVYQRILRKDKKETFLIGKNPEIIINPVEPVNLPKEISSHLYIEFENPVVLAPKEIVRVYITFPIEIGVLVASGKKYRVLDIFSFLNHKYTLYGDVSRGIICKYWKSKVYTKIPKLDPSREGVIRLKITNASDEWLDVNEAVFNAYGMKIYYNKNLVAMKAYMRVISEDIAETSFKDIPLMKKMKKSIEIYTARKIIPLKEKFIMEEGV